MKRKLVVLLAGIVILFSLCFYYQPENIISLFVGDFSVSEQEERPLAGSEEIAGDETAEAEAKETDGERESRTEAQADEDNAGAASGNEDGSSQFSESQLPSHLIYYYGTLSDDDKLLYRQIYVIMRDHLDYTQVNTTDADKIAVVMEYVLFDNPELFYVESLKTRTTTKGSSETMKVTAAESMTESEQKTAMQKISEFSADALAGITSGMSQYEQALHLYAYVVSNLTYVQGASYNQSLYSAALGQTVCRGYACAFKYLCDQAGISCIMVSGTMQGENHAWNLVSIDGQWCYVDCTAGDDLEGKAIAVDYSWFGLDDSLLSRSHEVYDSSLLPAAQTLANLYYYRKGLYFYGYSADNITGLLSAGEDFSFQCATEEVYNQYRSALSESEEIAQAIGPGNQVQFIGNGTSYTVYIQFQ